MKAKRRKEAQMDHTKRIGIASCILPVQEGMKLAGYARKRVCTGSHDPLLVQCVLLEENDRQNVFFVFDLLAVDALIIEPLTREIRRRFPKIETVLCAAIHTHSAPGGILNTDSGLLQAAASFAGKPDLPFCSLCVQSALSALTRAREDLEEFDSFDSRASSSRFASRRTKEKAVYDSPFYTIEIQRKHDAFLLVLMANHPTVLHEDNLQCSADLVWAMREALKEAGYKEAVVINGPCGDLSTRYTRAGSGMKEVMRIGRIAADAVLEGLKDKRPFSLQTGGLVNTEIILEKDRVCGDPNAARLRLQDADEKLAALKAENADSTIVRTAENEREAAAAQLIRNEVLEEIENVPVRCTIWTWSDQIFVTVPGELFSSLIEEERFSNMHFLCYTDGYILYLPDRRACNLKLYEAMASALSCGQSEYFVEEILRRAAQMDIHRPHS